MVGRSMFSHSLLYGIYAEMQNRRESENDREIVWAQQEIKMHKSKDKHAGTHDTMMTSLPATTGHT